MGRLDDGPNIDGSYRPTATRPFLPVTDELRAAMADYWRDLPDFPETDGGYLLDPGLGPPTYLSNDGRVLWEDDIWGVEPTRRQAFLGISAGLHKTKVELLRDLLPDRPRDVGDCTGCGGVGRRGLHPGRSAPEVVCGKCAGLGWAALDSWLDEWMGASGSTRPVTPPRR